LAEAREATNNARKLIKKGLDPSQQKQRNKVALHELVANDFETVAREWFEKNEHVWTPKHANTVLRRLEFNVFPTMGGRPIKLITAPELLAVLRPIEARGAFETAHRVHQICGQIFRYAVATGRAERDPSADLRGALTPVKPKNMPTLRDPKKIGGLLRAIAGYDGYIATKCALELAPLVFVRPGELRHAEWLEIDIETASWKIPAEKMKMRQPHIVPLSRQSIEVLKVIEPITGRGRYVFPSLRSSSRPISNNTVNAALRRMGFAKDEMCGHGFRSMASTILHEQGWPSHVIERQLAHAQRNTVAAAYNHAEYLAERKKMMQSWADYLYALRDGAQIISIHSSRTH
jgi:integrase